MAENEPKPKHTIIAYDCTDSSPFRLEIIEIENEVVIFKRANNDRIHKTKLYIRPIRSYFCYAGQRYNLDSFMKVNIGA